MRKTRKVLHSFVSNMWMFFSSLTAFEPIFYCSRNAIVWDNTEIIKKTIIQIKFVWHYPVCDVKEDEQRVMLINPRLTQQSEITFVYSQLVKNKLFLLHKNQRNHGFFTSLTMAELCCICNHSVSSRQESLFHMCCSWIFSNQ